MNDRIKLTLRYFPFPGRGGAIRDALRLGEVEFDDLQISSEEFNASKAAGTLPFGSLPVLVIESRQGLVEAAQSNAILRYVGRLTNLYPESDPLVALKIDEALDFAEDLYKLLAPSMVEPDLDRKAMLRKELSAVSLPVQASNFEKLLKTNGSTGFVVGNELSIADLKLYWVVDKLTNGSLDGIPKKIFGSNPTILRWFENIKTMREKAAT